MQIELKNGSKQAALATISELLDSEVQGRIVFEREKDSFTVLATSEAEPTISAS